MNESKRGKKAMKKRKTKYVKRIAKKEIKEMKMMIQRKLKQKGKKTNMTTPCACQNLGQFKYAVFSMLTVQKRQFETEMKKIHFLKKTFNNCLMPFLLPSFE